MERTAITIAGPGSDRASKINGPDEMWTSLCEGATKVVDTVKDLLEFAGDVDGGKTVNVSADPGLGIDPDKVYIITEGASGLGIELAKWLINKGARKLALLSRKGPKTEYDRNAIQAMTSCGISVHYECLDITFPQDVVNCIGRIRLNAAIGGLIHCAAVVRDASVPYMTEKVFDAVFMPKVVGAWNLHLALGDEPVEFFLNISTISHQSTCSKAHKVLEEFVGQRKLKGLRAQNVNLGVVGHYPRTRMHEGSALLALESNGWVPLPLVHVTDKIEHSILEERLLEMAAI